MTQSCECGWSGQPRPQTLVCVSSCGCQADCVQHTPDAVWHVCERLSVHRFQVALLAWFCCVGCVAVLFCSGLLLPGRTVFGACPRGWFFFLLVKKAQNQLKHMMNLFVCCLLLSKRRRGASGAHEAFPARASLNKELPHIQHSRIHSYVGSTAAELRF